MYRRQLNCNWVERLEARLLLAFDLDLVADLNSQVASVVTPDKTKSAQVRELVEFGDSLFFAASSGLDASQLWELPANGSIENVGFDNRVGAPEQLIHTADAIFAVSSRDIWKLDAARTRTEIFSTDATISYAFAAEGILYFRTSGELWRTDGTASGTGKILGLTDYSVEEVHKLNDDAVLLLTSPSRDIWTATPGYALWRVDRGNDHAMLVIEDLGLILGKRDRPQGFAHLDEQLYFGMEEGLWRSDGTPQGTGLVQSTHGRGPEAIVNVDGTIFFTAGSAIWKSDGTETGTSQIVPHIHALTSWASRGGSVNAAVSFRGNYYFRGLNARRNAMGSQLWVSNGTSEGTRLVKDLTLGEPQASLIRDLVVLEDKLVVITREERDHIWISDGTTDGTHEIIDLQGNQLMDIHDVVEFDGSTYFAADDGVHGRELWRVREVLDGDVDLDGHVGFSDFLILAQHFGKSVDAVMAEGDLNGDEMVTIQDFLILSANFGLFVNM